MEENVFMPEVGRLIMRVHSGQQTQFDLCFLDQANSKCYQRICMIKDFKAEPNFSSFIECMPYEGIVNEWNHSTIHRRYCTWDEMCALQRLWSSRSVTFEDWLDEVLETKELAEVEKNRLRRAFVRPDSQV